MKKPILFFFAAFLFSSIQGQPLTFSWAYSIGSTHFDVGQSVAVDQGGDIYTTGYFFGTADFDPGSGVTNLTSTGSADLFVTRTSSSGQLIWARSMGGVLFDEGRALGLDTLGNVYLTGRFGGTVDFDPGPGVFNLTSNGGDDVFICKLDNNGDFLWAVSLGGATSFDIGQDLAVTPAGNVYTTGFYTGTVDFDPGAGTLNLTSAGMQDIFVLHLDPSGNPVWARSMGGSNLDFGLAIDLGPAGEVYTTGHFRDTTDLDPGPATFPLISAGEQDVFFSKLDANGDFLWGRSLEGPGNDGGQALAVDDLGNVYTTGYFEDSADFDPGAGTFFLTSAGGADIFIQKLDASGQLAWAKRLGGSDFEDGSAILIDQAQEVFLTGFFQGTADFNPGAGTQDLTSTGGQDLFLTKLNAAGDLLWVEQIGDQLEDGGLDIALDADENLYVTGYFEDRVDFDPGPGITELLSAGLRDGFLLKLEPMVSSLSELKSLRQAYLFPNPASEWVELELGDLTQEVRLRLFDLNGRLLAELPAVRSGQRIQLPAPSGIYCIELGDGSNKIVLPLVKK